MVHYLALDPEGEYIFQLQLVCSWLLVGISHVIFLITIV